jgi:hypothetical protein
LIWNLSVNVGERHAATGFATKVFEILSNELAVCLGCHPENNES